MTMANIKLINAEERPVLIKRTQALTAEEHTNLKIRMELILQYKDGIDSVGLQMEIAYMLSDDDILLEYQALFVMENDEWLDFMKRQPADDEIRKYSGEMFDVALGYARSTISTNTKGTALESLYLPVFDKDKYTKDVNIIKV